MELRDLLIELSSTGRLRPLVRAQLACLQAISPATMRGVQARGLLRVAERWLVGVASSEDAREAAAQPSAASLVLEATPVRTIASCASERDAMLGTFARAILVRASSPDAITARAGAAARGDLCAQRGHCAIDPTGRFEATAELWDGLYAPGFDPDEPRARARALRERGPVRLFASDGARLADLAPPADSWAFGAHLAFASHGEELFVEVSDRHAIQIVSRDDSGAWLPRTTLAIPRQRWADAPSFALLGDDLLWARGVLFRRVEGDAWARCAEGPRPRAVSGDRSAIAWEVGGKLEVRRGRPYAWDERAQITLPTHARLDEVTFDVTGHRLAIVLFDVRHTFERREAIGWVQLEPVSPARSLEVEQARAAPEHGDFAAAAHAATPWVLGFAHPVGAWIQHPRFGLGIVLAHDTGRGVIEVRFQAGEPRRFKVQ